ncbi:MAG TPA: class II aldolase/adducin family protein [Thermomicrobiales bacterium]|nr:class II aldolase/adducin family protein [Thermomicrobiales bacterium]
MTTQTQNLAGLRQSIVDAGKALVHAGVLSPSLHGNMSARVPGTDTILLTSGSSLAEMHPDDLALLTLDGRVLEGQINPVTHEIVHMHTAVYQQRADVGGVIHTHSPFSTSFAVANKPLGVFAEALARFGVEEPIPVAAYAPRGSRESVSNIVDAIGPKTKAVLLQNHGILTFGDSIEMARTLVLVMEEAAQMAINATILGGATVIPPEMMRYTQERPKEFAAQGTVARGAVRDDK